MKPWQAPGKIGLAFARAGRIQSMSQVQQHPVQAIGLMMVSIFMMSTMDVAIKMLVEDYGSFQVIFFRCLISMPLFLAWILATGRSQFKTAYPVGHLLRGVLGLGMLYAVGECFREMQLADAYALFFAAPILITLLSGPVLGEPAGPVRLLASVVGFIGVLVVLNPSGGDWSNDSGDGWISYGATMGLVAVVLYSITSLLLRKLGSQDGTVTIAFWFVTLVGVGAGLLAIPSWKPVNLDHWPALTVLGISGTLGQVFLTAAFRRASVAVIAPFDYVHMLWAILYGYVFWSYLPGTRTWVGSGILVGSGLFILYRERQSMRRQVKIIHDG
jgi:drug/metabolite transporter (DMT)-like permease